MGDSLTNASIPLGICFKTYAYALMSMGLGTEVWDGMLLQYWRLELFVHDVGVDEALLAVAEAIGQGAEGREAELVPEGYGSHICRDN